MPEFRSFDGVTLHFDLEGDGAPVVLLHGFAADTDLNWRQPGIMRALADAGKTAVGLDARGHGRSQKCHDPAAYAGEAMVADVCALFDHLHMDEADLVGYSMGSATALRFALRDHRLGRLVLGGTDGNLAGTAAGTADQGSLIADGLEAEDPESITDPVALRFRRFAETNGADRLALAAVQRGRRRTPIPREVLAKIRVPTLVVCGADDVSPHELAAALPAGRARIVPGDHLSAVMEPALASAIVDFLTEEPNGT